MFKWKSLVLHYRFTFCIIPFSPKLLLYDPLRHMIEEQSREKLNLHWSQLIAWVFSEHRGMNSAVFSGVHELRVAHALTPGIVYVCFLRSYVM